MSQSKSAKVRSQLQHPVIDADGHWRELSGVYYDYVCNVAGAKVADVLRNSFGTRTRAWYSAVPEERRRGRMTRPPFWGTPSNIRDISASIIPRLFRERLDEWGIDVAVVFPSIGLGLSREIADPELRMAAVRSYNVMVADLFKPFADRMIPVGVLSLTTPEEAIAQLEHAHSLGLRQLVTGGAIVRRFEDDAKSQPDPQKRRVYVDALALDSGMNYDPVWQKFVDLKMAVATHSGSMGWPDRNSPSNFVANHLGHFAQSHHLVARSLFLGGVTQRFPTLNFGFLEGGVGWACNLYADLMGHWEKRNKQFMAEHLKPSNLDRAALAQLLRQYMGGHPSFEGRFEELATRHIESSDPALGFEEATQRDLESNDFVNVDIRSKADVRRLFARNFYFGCEADDPMTAVAFNEKMRLRLKPVMGSDISHFDVVDPSEVIEEAFEMVEHELISEDNFREFTFTNAARMFAGMNPDFFKGTLVEEAVKKELATATDPTV